MFEELALIRDIGIAAAVVILMFQFMKWISEKSFQQIEKAQQQINENNEKMFKFMECTFKENTKAINEMVGTLKDHIRMKDEAISLLKERENHLEQLRYAGKG
uniref:Holin n=1 Tax=viral metagenome TaxID=1070528 RepID=A0A6M3L3Y0_9ZZZZ